MADANVTTVSLYNIHTQPYKQGFIHTKENGSIRASCCGVNSYELGSVQAAKLWITKTCNSLDLHDSTIEVIF